MTVGEKAHMEEERTCKVQVEQELKVAKESEKFASHHIDKQQLSEQGGGGGEQKTTPFILKRRAQDKQCVQQKKQKSDKQMQNYSPLDLWDERSIYIYICKGDESACVLISVLPLIVLTSTQRLMISYSSLVEFREASVTRETSGRFHAFPPCRLTLPFVSSCSSHPIEGIFEMQCTH